MADDKTVKIIDETLPADDQPARDYVRYGCDGNEYNVLLSAAAGSGKTRTLVDRIVEKVKNLPAGKHIDSLVVVTFTRAAAAELVGRIEAALLKEIKAMREQGRTGDADRLVNELYLLPKTSIGTLDAFCLELVRKNFTEIGSCTVDSSFVLDNDLAAVIRKETVEKVLEKYYAEGPETEDGKIIKNILTSYNSIKDDKEFSEDLIKICEFCDSLPDPYAWLDMTEAKYDIGGDLRKNDWYQNIKKGYLNALDESRNHAEKTVQAILNDSGRYDAVPANEKEVYSNCLTNLIGVIDAERERVMRDDGDAPALFATENISKSKEIGSPPRIQRKDLKTPEDWKKYREKTLLKEELDIAKGNISSFYTDWIEKLIIGGSAEKSEKVFVKCVEELGGYVSLVCRIVRDIYRQTVDECAVRKSFSFAQIAHFALEVLCAPKTPIGNETPETLVPSEVAKAYRRRVDEIYVDEYQDTSMLQEFILHMVSGISDKNNPNNNMIMVGDLKQSIYSFRNAKPRLMINKSTLFEGKKGGVLLHLSRNFRSRKGIIDGVNEIFSNVMTAETADIDYRGGSHRLEYGAVEKYKDIPVAGDPAGGRCELIYSTQSTKTDLEAETAVLADRIRELKAHFKVADVKTGEDGREVSYQRDLSYGDICILANDNNAIGKVSAALSEAGFPVDAKSEEFFFERDEIQDILNFVRIIDNPRNDIPLVIVLRSPYFGFTDQELAEVRASALEEGCGVYADMWELLAISAKATNPIYKETSLKAADAVKAVNELRELAENINVSSFVWKLINFRDYYRNADDIAKGNLRRFLSFSYPFDKGVFGGLYGFVRNMDRTVSADSDPSKKPYNREKSYTVASDAPDKIKIMTIHKSKGLEFPVVICIDANHPRKKLPAPHCCCSEDLGIGLNFQYEDGGTYKKLGKAAPNLAMTLEQTAEQIKERQRVAYVALTRAKEKLIVIGSKKSENEANLTAALMEEEPGAQVITTASINSQKSLFRLILMGIERNGNSAWVKRLVSDEETEELKLKMIPSEDANETDSSGAEPAETVPSPETGEKLPAGDIAEYEDGDLRAVTEALETANAGAMPVKISVSALKRYSEESDGEEGEEGSVFKIEAKEFPSNFGNSFAAAVPAAAPGAAPDGMQRGARFGTVMHRLMKYLVENRGSWPERSDRAKVYEFIAGAIETLRGAGAFSAEEAALASVKMAANFLLSDRGEQVRLADNARCEVPFTYRVDVKKYLPFAKQAEEDPGDIGGDGEASNIKSSLKERNVIALQGVIDLYYKIGTHIAVLDFKTDSLERQEDGNTLEAYKLQIRCYRDALAEISGREPDESLLFFLRNGKEVKLTDEP